MDYEDTLHVACTQNKSSTGPRELYVAERRMVFHRAGLHVQGARLQFHGHERLIRNFVFRVKTEPGGRPETKAGVNYSAHPEPG